jgi:putative ABC transport system permease protein
VAGRDTSLTSSARRVVVRPFPWPGPKQAARGLTLAARWHAPVAEVVPAQRRVLWQSHLVHVFAAAPAPTPDWRLAVVLLVLVVLAMAASYLGQLGVERDHVTAAARAVVQLAVVSFVIAAALRSVWWSLAIVLVMYLVAVGTSARRLNLMRPQWPWVGAAIAAGVLPVLALSLGSGVIPFNGAGIVPIAGIVIGGMMTASTLTGRRASDELIQQFGSYEAGLSLGMQQEDAAFLVVQPAGREALTPGLDQTRTVGLVTLPGAFIGVLLGGGSPYDAAAAQILVLVGLMAGQAITAAVLLRFIAAGHVVRRDLLQIYPR